jgi:hypothetical protein
LSDSGHPEDAEGKDHGGRYRTGRRFPFRRMTSRKGLNFGCVKLANCPKNGCHIEE